MGGGGEGGVGGALTIDDEGLDLVGGQLQFALHRGEVDLLLVLSHQHQGEQSHLLKVVIVQQPCKPQHSQPV